MLGVHSTHLLPYAGVMPRWFWWTALLAACGLTFAGSLAWSSEDATNLNGGRYVSSGGHAVSGVMFVVAGVVAVISIIRLVRD